MSKQWFVYMLECKDGTLYTGTTDNVARRLAMHRSGRGAKYTRGRAPLILRYTEICADLSAALHREIEIKKLAKSEKIALWQASPAREE